MISSFVNNTERNEHQKDLLTSVVIMKETTASKKIDFFFYIILSYYTVLFFTEVSLVTSEKVKPLVYLTRRRMRL